MKTTQVLLFTALIIAGSVFFLNKGQDQDKVQAKVERDPQVSNGTSGDFKYPCKPEDAARYTSYHIKKKSIKIDGKLNEDEWKNAPRSPRYVDIITGLPTRYDTFSAVLWDDENLYAAFWVEEPNVQAHFTERNSPVWQENDVEVFIAGRDAYYEFEINARNTVYEVFFVWEAAYEKGGYSQVPELMKTSPGAKPFPGVGYTSHPRLPRNGFWDYRLKGLKTAVHVDGTLNDDKDVDKGWTVELAFPWASMDLIARGDGRPLPPDNGDVWRMDFSRFNKEKAPSPPEDSTGWFWSPHGIWDSHIPECFPYIHFSTKDVKDAGAKK